MPSISSLEAIISVFLAFAIACAVAGRSDISLKLVTEIRAKTIKGASASWGCPSFRKEDCHSYDSRRYR